MSGSLMKELDAAALQVGGGAAAARREQRVTPE
jgi:hypothetical protein